MTNDADQAPGSNAVTVADPPGADVVPTTMVPPSEKSLEEP